MESRFLLGLQEEKAELRVEVSRLQNELAESHAEREELESRARALTDRVRGGETSVCFSIQPGSVVAYLPTHSQIFRLHTCGR